MSEPANGRNALCVVGLPENGALYVRKCSEIKICLTYEAIGDRLGKRLRLFFR